MIIRVIRAGLASLPQLAGWTTDTCRPVVADSFLLEYPYQEVAKAAFFV